MSKKDEIFRQRQLARSSDWKIVHGNLMTILMIFFLVMFYVYNIKTSTGYEKVISSIQSEFGGEIDEEMIDRAEYMEMENKVAHSIREEEGLKKFTKVETDREKIKIIFPDPIIFDSGSANLNFDSIWMLGEIAKRLKIIPENNVIIEGHTDNIPLRGGGRFSSNRELSLARALSIVYYLTEMEGLRPERFVPIGYGEYKPLYSNETPEGRAKNRRIEISVIKKG